MNPEYVTVIFKDLKPGQKLVFPDRPTYPPRTVKKVERAKANGYIVVLFEDGTRTSTHGGNPAYVMTGSHG
jgi:hypothetical protein